MNESHNLRAVPNGEGTDEETVEERLPLSLPEQELLNFTRGAKIDVFVIEQLYVDLGAAASQIEAQASTIVALQNRLKMVLEALKEAQKEDISE